MWLRRGICEAELELHRRVGEGLDGGEGDGDALTLATEAQGHREPRVIDLEVPVLVLQDDGEPLGVQIADRPWQRDALGDGGEGDEEMVVPGKPVTRRQRQRLAHHPAQRATHHGRVVDQALSHAGRVYTAPGTLPRSALLAVGGLYVAVAKAAGVSLATRATEPGAAVGRLLDSLAAEDRHELPAGDLLLVHRLDVGTSGVVLLARGADAHRQLVAAFGERRVEKTYLAVVWGRARPREGRWDSPLGPDRADRRRMRVDPDGRAARTAYRTLAVAPHLSLVALRAETGRTHQLRVHLAAAGHPIVGDDLYGGPRHRGIRDRELRGLLDPGRPLLHAWRLALPAPPLDRPVTLEAPWPPDFAAVLAALGWRQGLAPGVTIW